MIENNLYGVGAGFISILLALIPFNIVCLKPVIINASWIELFDHIVLPSCTRSKFLMIVKLLIKLLRYLLNLT